MGGEAISGAGRWHTRSKQFSSSSHRFVSANTLRSWGSYLSRGLKRHSGLWFGFNPNSFPLASRVWAERFGCSWLSFATCVVRQLKVAPRYFFFFLHAQFKHWYKVRAQTLCNSRISNITYKYLINTSTTWKMPLKKTDFAKNNPFAPAD